MSNTATTRKKRKTGNYSGLIYILPWLFGFLLLQVYPFLSSLFYSFTDLSMLKSPHFIGIQNYINIFKYDSNFWKSLAVTLKYVFIAVPLKLAFALFIAMLLNRNMRLISFFKVLYYLPSILGGSVGIAILWRFLFSKDGFVNILLGYIGISPINWLGSPNISLITIILLTVWQFGSSMIIFLAALKQIPAELYEAADVDGASNIRKFTKITIPMITPIILFNIIMQMINAFQEFTGPYLITKGGPLKSTYLYGLLIYDNAFNYLKMGYASALSWIMFIIIMVFTLFIFRSSSNWVFYQDGENNV
jgi:oligogalacturonide transport system permease protein